MIWTKKSVREAARYPLFTAEWHAYQREDDVALDAIVLNVADSVNIVALTPQDELLLVNQFRFGSETDELELPGGVVDPGEETLEAAKRELQEETGYGGDDWEYLGYVYSNPVFMTGKCHHYLLRQAIRMTDTSFDDTEYIDVQLWHITEIQKSWLKLIRHPHAISALAHFFDHQHSDHYESK